MGILSASIHPSQVCPACGRTARVFTVIYLYFPRRYGIYAARCFHTYGHIVQGARNYGSRDMCPVRSHSSPAGTVVVDFLSLL